MNYKGVIFDLDGTLIDSIEDIGTSLNVILDQYGYEVLSMKKYQSLIGQGLLQLVKDSTPDYIEAEEVERIFEAFVRHYGEHYKIKTKPYDGIELLLTRLHKDGVLLGVNSNKKDSFTKDLVKTLFPNIPFTLVLGDREGVNKKPDPTSAHEIITAMRLKPSEVIYVGDTDHDMKTAENAGIESIGVTWGYRSEAQLLAANATYIAQDIRELYELISKK